MASTTELAEYKSGAGEVIRITGDDVRKYICPGATDKEVVMFLKLCQTHRLDPWTGDAYLIKYGDKPAQIQTGKEAFTKRAAANPDFEGYECGIVYADAQGHIARREGSAYYPSVGEQLVGGWCEVFVKDKRPFYDEVSLQEYSTGRSLWASKPATMIRKVALVHCLREAFPQDFAGLYSEEEMPDGQAPQAQTDASLRKRTATKKPRTTQKPQATEVKPEVEPVEPQDATHEQLLSLGDKMTELASLRGVDFGEVQLALMRTETMRAAGLTNFDAITYMQAEKLLAMADRWLETARKYAPQKPQAVEVTQEVEGDE